MTAGLRRVVRPEGRWGVNADARRVRRRLLAQDALLLERRILVGGHPEKAAQHVLGVLPELRCGRPDVARRLRERDRVHLGWMAADHGMLDFAEVAPVRELRVVVEIAEIEDG